MKRGRDLEELNLMGWATGIFSTDFYKAAGETAVGMDDSSPRLSAFGAGYDLLAINTKESRKNSLLRSMLMLMMQRR